MAHRVAICQAGLIRGGRLQVVLGLIELLNEAGITPDVLTMRLGLDPADLRTHNGRPLQANLHLLPNVARLPNDFSIILFNRLLSRCTKDYDLLINTSNSLIFLPKRREVLTYLFFPRKRRIMDRAADIHQPERPLASWSKAGLQRRVLRLIYRLSRPQPHHRIVCLSEFTRTALEQVYDMPPNLPVIYPPVALAKFAGSEQPRERAVVTVGRFAANKRQMEQLRLAAGIPGLAFHLVGFTGDGRYYRQCRRFAEENGLPNVRFHPDAPFAEMRGLLQSSRYFLHTLVNEPFGITAVQAIAAGCIPIVHDSGGQRETVPETALRYQTLDEVPAMIERLEALDAADLDELGHRLRQHVYRHFDESIFKRKISEVLSPYLL